MKIVDVPQVTQDDGAKLDYAIEIAFNSLRDKVIDLGLLPPEFKFVALMYLPEQEATEQFKEGCRKAIECLQRAVKRGE